MSEICINLVFEDALSESVLRKLLLCSRTTFLVGRPYNAGGYGGIKRRINGFNNAAKGMPYLVLTDLDVGQCAPLLLEEWLSAEKHPNLLFRVAVREVEAWLLACRRTLAEFLGVLESRIPVRVDAIEKPKEFLVNLARRSRKRDIRVDIVPQEDSTAKVGPGYNGRLVHFTQELWSPDMAKENSPSLRKAIEALEVFQPTF